MTIKRERVALWSHLAGSGEMCVASTGTAQAPHRIFDEPLVAILYPKKRKRDFNEPHARPSQSQTLLHSI
jgi:hypothetical protein